MTSVGILGGTGRLGRALAHRLCIAGYDVGLGSRDPVAARSQDIVHGAAVTDLAGAAGAKVVVVAVPSAAIAQTLTPLASALTGKVIISAVNQWDQLRPSAADAISACIPDASVATAFNHIAAARLAGSEDIDADVLVAHSDQQSWLVAKQLIGAVPTLRAVDVGGLEVSGAIESMTQVLIGINKRYSCAAQLKVMW